MAGTIDTAITNGLNTIGAGANAFKGTAAQRTAFLSTAVNGMLWQDTDSIKMIWRKDGAAWVPAVWRWSGTTAQMNAFTQAPNGFEWFNTTDNGDYVRLGGVWRGGVGTIAPGSGITLAASILAKNRNGSASLVIRANHATNLQGVRIGTLPNGFLPSVVWAGLASSALASAGNQACSLRLDNGTGAITVIGLTAASTSVWASFDYPLATP